VLQDDIEAVRQRFQGKGRDRVEEDARLRREVFGDGRQEQIHELHACAEPPLLPAPGTLADLVCALTGKLERPGDSITVTINLRREKPHA
jgi:hypothetical protein